MTTELVGTRDVAKTINWFGIIVDPAWLHFGSCQIHRLLNCVQTVQSSILNSDHALSTRITHAQLPIGFSVKSSESLPTTTQSRHMKNTLTTQSYLTPRICGNSLVHWCLILSFRNCHFGNDGSFPNMNLSTSPIPSDLWFLISMHLTLERSYHLGIHYPGRKPFMSSIISLVAKYMPRHWDLYELC